MQERMLFLPPLCGALPASLADFVPPSAEAVEALLTSKEATMNLKITQAASSRLHAAEHKLKALQAVVAAERADAPVGIPGEGSAACARVGSVRVLLPPLFLPCGCHAPA